MLHMATERPTRGSEHPGDLFGLDDGALFAGRYRIEHLLGKGAMGAVYRAHDLELDEVIALKVMTFAHEDAVDRFRREVRLARRVTHSNVARTHDLGRHEDAHYLTMEWLEGRSLEQQMEAEGCLPAAECARVAAEVCEALAAAHGVDVIHRDLKPGNIMLGPTGRVAITDFGIARSVTGGDLDGGLTVGAIGTPDYMAPEQVEGADIDGRSDLYALGVMLFEMLTGSLPFQERTPIATAVARLKRPPPDPRSLASVPDALAEQVLRCLARYPDDRPASAAELASTLWGLAGRDAAAGDAATDQLPSRKTAVVGEVASDDAAGGTAVGDATGFDAVPAGDDGDATVADGSMPVVTSATPSLEALAQARALAVLPFVYRGPPDDAWIADVLTDEVVDMISMTRGLRVFASGATSKYRDERDPRVVGTDLGAELIVDGTVIRSGESLRASTRLVEVASGVQIWSGRFEGRSADVMSLPDMLSKRIAETLRLEMASRPQGADVPDEAVELYMLGRHRLHKVALTGEDGAIALLDRALELAPTLAPAMAAHAIASITAWFITDDDGDWQERCSGSVARALELAADLAESHQAAAMLAAQAGDYQEAVTQLRAALEIAPTSAGAHRYFGYLLCEAGIMGEGMRRLTLAAELDPGSVISLLELARRQVLEGDDRGADRSLALVEERGMIHHRGVKALQARCGLWRGDQEAARAYLATITDETLPVVRAFRCFAQTACGDMPPQVARFQTDKILSRTTNMRFATLVRQLMTEAMAEIGHSEYALEYLREAAASALLDIHWLDRCPPLAPLRAEPAFEKIRGLVRARAEVIRTG